MDCHAALAKTNKTVIAKECNDCGDPYLVDAVEELSNKILLTGFRRLKGF